MLGLRLAAETGRACDAPIMALDDGRRHNNNQLIVDEMMPLDAVSRENLPLREIETELLFEAIYCLDTLFAIGC